MKKLLLLIVGVAIAVSLMAIRRPLIEIKTPVISCLSASPTLIHVEEGFGEFICSNESTDVVWLLEEGVAASRSATHGFKICRGADCNISAIDIPVNQGSLYCQGASTDVDLRCIMGR